MEVKDEMKTIKSIIETIPELDHLDIYTCMSNVLRRGEGSSIMIN